MCPTYSILLGFLFCPVTCLIKSWAAEEVLAKKRKFVTGYLFKLLLEVTEKTKCEISGLALVKSKKLKTNSNVVKYVLFH